MNWLEKPVIQRVLDRGITARKRLSDISFFCRAYILNVSVWLARFVFYYY